MRDKGYLDPQETANTAPLGPEEIAQFTNGDAACVCSAMSAQSYWDAEQTGFETRMTGWPLLKDGYIAVVGTDQKLCINPKSEHLDIVTAFVEMAGSPEALMQRTDEGKVSSGKVNDPSKAGYCPKCRRWNIKKLKIKDNY